MAESKKQGLTKVDRLRPNTTGHNLTVKVVDSKIMGRANGPQPRQTRLAECLVGDETGMIIFTARNEQVDKLKPGKIVTLSNAKIDIFKGSMRLLVDKSGRVDDATDPADLTVKEDINFSLVEFELVTVIVD